MQRDSSRTTNLQGSLQALRGGYGELLAQGGIEVSREKVRCWVIKFGPMIAANLRRRRQPPTGRCKPRARRSATSGRKASIDGGAAHHARAAATVAA